MKQKKLRYVWEDRTRMFGLPITFTRYCLSEDRLFREKGFLSLRQEEIELYRIRDLRMKIRLEQRIFGVGTITVYSTDETTPLLHLINIARPREVKELIHQYSEECKLRRRMRFLERAGMNPDSFDETSLDFTD